jgi:hypothetical protein
MLRQEEGSRLFESPAASYVYELTHDYDGPLEQVARYIGRRGGGSLMTFSGRFTLLFHTEFELVNDFDHGFPDWILFHSAGRPRWSPETMAAVRARYAPVGIDVPNQLWENIPEPYWHRFKAADAAESGRVTLLKRVR